MSKAIAKKLAGTARGMDESMREAVREVFARAEERNVEEEFGYWCVVDERNQIRASADALTLDEVLADNKAPVAVFPVLWEALLLGMLLETVVEMPV